MRFFSLASSCIPLALIGLVLFSPGLAHDTARAETPDQDDSAVAHLYSTDWSASAYSYQAGGSVCWIQDAEGSLRLELFNGPADPGDESLEPLLTRNGDGWTLILGPTETGTLNAWNREWQAVPQGLAQVVRLVTESLRCYPDEKPRFSFASPLTDGGIWGGIPSPAFLDARLSRTAGSLSWRYQLASIELESSEASFEPDFRQRMTSRGRGTGGAGEIVELKWRKAPNQEGLSLEVASSRRPGTLRLDPVRARTVSVPEPEVFLPLWPLSQFYEIR